MRLLICLTVRIFHCAVEKGNTRKLKKENQENIEQLKRNQEERRELSVKEKNAQDVEDDKYIFFH